MSIFTRYCRYVFLILPFLFLSTTCQENTHTLTKQTRSNSSITTIFVFGDSTVDPGNNNHIKTFFKSDFLPYGVDFPDQNPTGRFCNGRLTTDFIASYIGVKQVIPAYLDPTLSLEDLITGVSFASAGSGYDPITSARNNVLDMSRQLQYFQEYKERIQSMIGKKRMENILKHSVFLVSCGSNDIIYTYGIGVSPLQSFTISTYLHFLLEQSKAFIQALQNQGAIKIAVVGLPPVGCLPAIITLHPSHKPRRCVESVSAIARDFNQLLQNELKTMQASQPSTLITYADIYTPLEHQINFPQEYGFEVVDKGCCGTGLLEASFVCASSPIICSDRSKYVFWDAIHPTQRSYSLLFDALRPLIDHVVHG